MASSRSLGVRSGFFAVYEVYLSRQKCLQLRISLTRQILGAQNGGVDALYHVLEMTHCALLIGYHRFPVPLVHVERVQIVQFFIGAYSVHVGIDAVARFNLVFSQREPLPLGQRVHHFGFGVAQVEDGERHGALGAVQVVVDAQSFEHKERCSNPLQPQFGREVLLKEVLDQLDAMFGLTAVKYTLVFFIDDKFTHDFVLNCLQR